jgi:predicted TIM-barrel fold metal-dependent hydrolase
MTESSLVIDSSVHPYFVDNDEIRDYIKAPWKHRGIPGVEKWNYSAPGGRDYAAEFDGIAGYPATDPAEVSRRLFDEQGIDYAVLLPLGRGNNPDRRLGSVICAGINDWLAERWLDQGNPHGRFKGTIRINPYDPEGAVREIERWAGHPHMVQIGAPLESREPYGKPQYWPIWETAAKHRLPVTLHIDGGAGIENPPTPAGSPRTFAAYAALAPLNLYYHLFNLIAEGVFERLEDLVFVFGDGGGDLITPLGWRYDLIARAYHDITPWAPQPGTDYLRGHVRFCTSELEGPWDQSMVPGWYDMTGKADLLLYGSHYPHWNMGSPGGLPEGLTDEQRRKILGGNAAELYGLTARVPA